MLCLTDHEQELYKQIKQLKDQAGTHSPSMFTILENIPEIKIQVDACFLSNPYATELFLDYVKRELLDTGKMRDLLEFYPSQNEVIAEILSKHLNVNPNKIFIGNGAIEIIQAIIHHFTKRKIIVNIPTFSSYYEFVKPGVDVVYNQLDKDNNYRFNLDGYLEFVKKQKPDTIVLINPNNPNGGYMIHSGIEYILDNLPEVENIIVDESFIHFAFESDEYQLKSTIDLIDKFDNLIIVKSMSKDFGIAGIRAGYAIMNEERVSTFLKNGYLWNSNGLAEYFFRLYVRKDFIDEYEKIRIWYIQQTQKFLSDLNTIEGIKVYPSKANFALVEFLNGFTSNEFMAKLLISHGIYVRTCSDKIGLDGEFVRIASRTKEENDYILKVMKELCET